MDKQPRPSHLATLPSTYDCCSCAAHLCPSLLGLLSVVGVDARLPVGGLGGSVDALVPPSAEVEVLLEQVEHGRHLGEEQHAVPSRLEPLQHGVQQLQLARHPDQRLAPPGPCRLRVLARHLVVVVVLHEEGVVAHLPRPTPRGAITDRHEGQRRRLADSVTARRVGVLLSVDASRPTDGPS